MTGIIKVDTIQVDSIKTKTGGAQSATNLGLSGGAGKNIIINGDMAVAQRATSYAVTTDGAYGSLDRFAFYNSNDGAFTVSQDTTIPSGEGFLKSMKFDCTTADGTIAAGQYATCFQNIEGLNHSVLGYGAAGAKTITVSFWAKSNLTGPFCYSVRNSAVDRSFVKEFSLSTADTWERISFSITGDTTGTWLTTNGLGARHMIALSMGSTFHGTNNTWQSGNKTATSNQVNFLSNTSNELYVTGWQVEIGSVASEFEHKKYADTLNDCYRYLYRIQRTDAYGEFLTIRTYSATAGTGVMMLPVSMRASPTFTSSTVNTSNFSYSITSIGSSGTDSSNRLNTHNAVGAFTANGAAVIQKANNADMIFFQYDAEL